MSRSYRKHPVERWWSSRHQRRQGRNRRFRRMKNKEVPKNGSAYKKYVVDWWGYPNYYYSWRVAEKEYHLNCASSRFFKENYPTEEDFYIYWKKNCRGK